MAVQCSYSLGVRFATEQAELLDTLAPHPGISSSRYDVALLILAISAHQTFCIAAPSLALQHYRAMNVKSVQNDTLSHYVLSHASTFSLASNGDITFTQECVEASQIYMANSSEVGCSVQSICFRLCLMPFSDGGVYRACLQRGEVLAGMMMRPFRRLRSRLKQRLS